MLLCLHEESAVAIAHGYAKVTQRMLGVVLHSNVGLMHATMAIFNAWCDRVPMLLLGATGPVDAKARRPWIDWIHTAADQGALIRDYTKWDDQPALGGAPRSMRSRTPSSFPRRHRTRPCTSTSTPDCRKKSWRRRRACRTWHASHPRRCFAPIHARSRMPSRACERRSAR